MIEIGDNLKYVLTYTITPLIFILAFAVGVWLKNMNALDINSKEKFYILEGKRVIPVDIEKWYSFFSIIENKIIKQETTKNGFWVSTVFLRVDHNYSGSGKPLLFETMVFNNKESFEDLDIDRYSIYEEAEKGHEKMVAKWTNNRTHYEIT